MSIHFYAIAIIGCKLRRKDLFLDELVRSCSCKLELQLPTKFCPHCGKEMFMKSERCIFNRDTMKMGTVNIASGTDGREFFAYILKSESGIEGTSDFTPILNTIDEYKIKLKEELDIYRLWREDTFGLWAIPYIS